MEEPLFVAEYKTQGEMFIKKFVWTGYEYRHDAHFFYNDLTGEELFIFHAFLETLLTRPIKVNEN